MRLIVGVEPVGGIADRFIELIAAFRLPGCHPGLAGGAEAADAEARIVFEIGSELLGDLDHLALLPDASQMIVAFRFDQFCCWHNALLGCLATCEGRQAIKLCLPCCN